VSNAQRDQTKAAYDTVAATYAVVLPDTSFEASLDLAMIQDFVDQLRDGEKADVLDVGCGAGRVITYLNSLDENLAITGVDLSPTMIEHAKIRHPNNVIVEGDLAALPFPDSSFDGVLAWYSVIHTPTHELAAIFDECHRILRPSGLMLVAFQSGSGERIISQPYGLDIELRAFLHQTPLVEAALHTAGFVIQASLGRAPRTTERHSQGFVLAKALKEEP
jgi:ubiquinone/menaquinone biosynthesis C-methylase UbiE